VVEITSGKLKNRPKMGLLWPTKPKREFWQAKKLAKNGAFVAYKTQTGEKVGTSLNSDFRTAKLMINEGG